MTFHYTDEEITLATLFAAMGEERALERLKAAYVTDVLDVAQFEQMVGGVMGAFASSSAPTSPQHLKRATPL
jgi:hypothetical protein